MIKMILRIGSRALALSLLIGLIVCCCLCPTALLKDNPTWQERLQIKLPAAARSLAYTRDGLSLAVGHGNGQVSIWDTKTGALQKLLIVGDKKVEALFFSRDGDRLITITKNNKATIWSPPDWTQLAVLEGITSVSGLSPDGHWLVTQNPKHIIVLWDLSTLKQARKLGETGLDGAVNINFTSDGQTIAAVYHQELNLIDATSGKISELPVQEKPKGMTIQQTGKDTFRMTMGSLDDDSAIVHRVIPSSTGSLLTVGRGWYGKPNFIDVWDYNTKTMIGRFKPKDDGAMAQLSFDNSSLAVGGAESVTIWSVASGLQTASLKASLVFEDTPLVKGSSLFLFSPVANELAVIDGIGLRIYSLR